MSPQLLFPEQFNLKEDRPTKSSDFYALGMVMCEILSGKAPFYQHSNFGVLWKILQGERPTRPQEPQEGWFTDRIWQMLELCWQHQPTHRISARTVLLHLEGGLSSHSNENVTIDAGGQSDTTSEEDEYVSPSFVPGSS